jgi:hypothetical protein
MYSSYSFSTSTLDGGEWSATRPGRALPPGKGPPVPIVQEAGWAPEPDTEVRGKILCPRRESNPDRPVVQPVVRHYTAWATRLHSIEGSTIYLSKVKFSCRRWWCLCWCYDCDAVVGLLSVRGTSVLEDLTSSICRVVHFSRQRFSFPPLINPR